MAPSGAGFDATGETKAYEKLVTQEFNVLQKDFPWETLRPTRDSFDFERSWTDWAVDFASNHGMGLEALHLIWTGHLPNWLLQGTFTQTELLSIMREHILEVAGRYRGRVKRWSVVNEHVAGRLFATRTQDKFWYSALGDDYIPKAFEWAREADPDAELILNEDANDGRRPDVTEGFFQLARQLKANGVPIDGVGMQMHILVEDPYQLDVITTESVQNLMARYGDLGLRVYVTEFDVDIRNLTGTEPERFALQAKIYRDMIRAAVDSDACGGFSVFTPGDKYSWIEGDGSGHGVSPNADPTPFNDDLSPKPAYFAMLEVLQEAAAR